MVFNLLGYYIVEDVSYDAHHSSRSINTIYAVDEVTTEETFLSQRGFAHGPELDFRTAFHYAKKLNEANNG